MLDMVVPGRADPADWDGIIGRYFLLAFQSFEATLSADERRELGRLGAMVGAMNVDEVKGGPARSFGKGGKWE